jgi:hypothetical protein
MACRHDGRHALAAERLVGQVLDDLGAQGDRDVDGAGARASGILAFHISSAISSTSGRWRPNARAAAGSVSKRALHE